MLRFASGLATVRRLAKNSILSIDHRLSWNRAYSTNGVKKIPCNVNRSPKAHDETEERFVPSSFRNDGGASFVKQVKNPRCHTDKTGRKYVSVIHHAICVEGIKAFRAGVNQAELQLGIDRAFEAVEEHLKCRARMVSTIEEIAQVGTTAANGDDKIGKLLTKAMGKVGMDIGSIVLSEKEKSENLSNELEFVRGMTLDLPSLSSYFFIKDINRTRVLKNPSILIYGDKISDMNVINKAIRLSRYRSADRKRKLLIVAEDVSMDVSHLLPMDRVNIVVSLTKACARKSPMLLENKKAIMQDLATLTGSQVVTRSTEMTKIQGMLGSCKEVRLSYDGTVLDGETVIIGGSGDLADIEERCEQLRSQIKTSTSDYEAKLLEFRLRKLSLGVAVLKVGGANLCNKNKRIDYAFDAVKAALEDGILPGGGVALLHVSKELNKLQIANPDQKIGVQILQNALKMPVFTIASVAGFDGSVVVEKLLKQDNPDLGYDPAKGGYVDMIASGIVDPLKITDLELDYLRRFVAVSTSRYLFMKDGIKRELYIGCTP